MEEKKQTYSVRLTPRIVKEVNLLCVHQNRFFSDVIEEGLQDILKKYKPKSSPKKKASG
jgi:mRNA-degrading endonuclease RelE of RelBE toxin-antitoxin system